MKSLGVKEWQFFSLFIRKHKCWNQFFFSTGMNEKYVNLIWGLGEFSQWSLSLSQPLASLYNLEIVYEVYEVQCLYHIFLKNNSFPRKLSFLAAVFITLSKEARYNAVAPCTLQHLVLITRQCSPWLGFEQWYKFLEIKKGLYLHVQCCRIF